MAIGVRDITNLEELLEVQDDDKIIVIQNGEAKLVSKANAKFGGGTATVFNIDPNTSSEPLIMLVDINGNPIGAQAAYDAVMRGPVYINFRIIGENTTMFLIPIIFGTIKNGAEIVSVMFTAINNGKNIDFYAGINPDGGNS